MEPLTQGLLGAAVGQLAAPRLGGRALGWGALVGMSPDLDVLLAPLHGGYGELVYHRGTTHSLWFGLVAGPLIAWLLWRWRDPERRTELRAWVRLCVLALVTHPLLDVFTPYGTQLFAPFWRGRLALHGVGIIDPFYTVILAWAVVLARQAAAIGPLRWRDQRRTIMALALSTVYLLAGVALNELARTQVRPLLAEGSEVRVYPTLLQPFLRRVVARENGRIWVGWHTSLAPGCPYWQSLPVPAETGEGRELAATWEGRTMRWFALDDVVLHTTPLPGGGSLVEMEDLRYGLPGQAPGRSMWGVRARYNAGGAREGPVERFRRDGRTARFSGLGSLTLGRFHQAGLAGELPAACANRS